MLIHHSDPDPFAYDRGKYSDNLPYMPTEDELKQLTGKIENMLLDRVQYEHIVVSCEIAMLKLTVTFSVLNGGALSDSQWALVAQETSDLVKDAFPL